MTNTPAPGARRSPRFKPGDLNQPLRTAVILFSKRRSGHLAGRRYILTGGRFAWFGPVHRGDRTPCFFHVGSIFLRKNPRDGKCFLLFSLPCRSAGARATALVVRRPGSGVKAYGYVFSARESGYRMTADARFRSRTGGQRKPPAPLLRQPGVFFVYNLAGGLTSRWAGLLVVRWYRRGRSGIRSWSRCCTGRIYPHRISCAAPGW